jgi:flagellar basal body-associated protein FliL
MKIIMVLLMLSVLIALGAAGFFMLRKGHDRKQRDASMARALALRVALSVALFLFILLGWFMGWVHPGGIPVGG